MTIKNLRQIGKAIRQAMTCPGCGGSVLIAATSYKGHGVGLEGSSYYSATGFESISPKKHCTCPGGPLWDELVKGELGEGFKLAEAQAKYPDLPKGQVPIWNPDNEQWCSVPAKLWRQAVIRASRSD